MVPKLNKASFGVIAVLAATVAFAGIQPTASAAGLDKKGMAEAKKATQLYKQGNYEEAAAIFLQLSIDNPGMPVFVRNLGACYYYLRRPAQEEGHRRGRQRRSGKVDRRNGPASPARRGCRICRRNGHYLVCRTTYNRYVAGDVDWSH